MKCHSWEAEAPRGGGAREGLNGARPGRHTGFASWVGVPRPSPPRLTRTEHDRRHALGPFRPGDIHPVGAPLRYPILGRRFVANWGDNPGQTGGRSSCAVQRLVTGSNSRSNTSAPAGAEQAAFPRSLSPEPTTRLTRVCSTLPRRPNRRSGLRRSGERTSLAWSPLDGARVPCSIFGRRHGTTRTSSRPRPDATLVGRRRWRRLSGRPGQRAHRRRMTARPSALVEMQPSAPHRGSRVAVSVLLAGVVLGGCSSSGTKPASGRTRSSGSSPPVVLSETANGTAVSVQVDGVVIVTLNSTYWQLSPPHGTARFDVLSAPRAQPGPSCPSIPGSGCGTVTATYRATSAGVAVVAAHRDACGEALRCVGTQGDWRATISVQNR